MMASPKERRNPNITTFNCDAVKHPLHFRCLFDFGNSLISFARRHFKLSTTKQSDISNPNIMHPLPTLPFDLITEILSRLPVKLLLRFRCVCKSWNSLICDHKFARKHFNLSTIPNLHVITPYDPSQRRYVLRSYPLQSLFTDLTTNFTQLGFPFNSPFEHFFHYIVGSCDGILCLADFHNTFVVLWNPSIRKFKELPLFEKPRVAGSAKFGFGYDHLSHSYKVVVLYNSYRCDIIEDTIKIKIYNSRTNSWRSFQKLPFTTEFGPDQSGVHVSGTINWLASTKWRPPLFILSFDLGKDSYQKIFPPEHGEFDGRLELCVLKDCLCILCDYDVWVMKEYGIKESWTKLFKLSNLPGQRKGLSRSYLTKAFDIFEDDQVLLVERRNKKKLILYDFTNDTFKVTSLFPTLSEICTESLISPCS